MPRRGSTRRWRRRRPWILARDGYRCRVPDFTADGSSCGAPATEVDHIVPESLGGDDSDGNLRAACKPCNAKRGTILGNRLRATGAPSRDW